MHMLHEFLRYRLYIIPLCTNRCYSPMKWFQDVKPGGKLTNVGPAPKLDASSLILFQHFAMQLLNIHVGAFKKILHMVLLKSKMAMFSTPKAPGFSAAKKQPMDDYSSLALAAPSPLPPTSITKSLFHCLTNIDEEDSSLESLSPLIPLDKDDVGENNLVGGLNKGFKSPKNRLQRRTTDSFRPVRCSLQALSSSSKKILPRMSFSSPNIMRGKSSKRPQTEKAKKSRRSSGVSQSNSTDVKLEMLNHFLETKNEEVANLKSSLQQSEQKVAMLESKVIALEEELKQQQQQQQQQQLETPSMLEMSFGSNSEYNTDHDSQTMPYFSEEQLEDLTNQLKGKNGEIEELEHEIEQWQEQANEWKDKYQALLEQMQNGTVSDEESTDTNDLINFCNECQEDDLEFSDAEEDVESSVISNTAKESPMVRVEETNETVTETNTARISNNEPQSPLPRGSTDSDENVNDENVEGGSVANRYLRNRAPLGESSLQNVQTTPISNTKRQSRRRQKTKRYSPTAAKDSKVNEVDEVDTPEENVKFGEVGYKFRKYFGGRYGSYNGQVKEILADGRRHCVYPADPYGDEYLTFEELKEQTKPLKRPSHGKVKKNLKKDQDVANPLELDKVTDDTTDRVLQVKKNVTCHIW